MTRPDHDQPPRGGQPRSGERALHSLTANLAATTVSFACSDVQVLEWMAERFTNFLSTAQAQWQIRFEITAPTPDFLVSPREVYPDRAQISPVEHGLRMQGREWRAEVDMRRQVVEMSGARATYPVDRVLRYLLPLLVDDGLVLHGGMLEGESGAWAFSGPSGSGKSTLCRLLPGQARCDEMVAVRRINGQWFAQALPFWVAQPALSPLRGIYLIGHGEADTRTPVSGAVAGRTLSRELLWPVADSSAIAHRLELLAQLAAEVPVWDLRFVPSPAVWQVITEDAA